MGRDQADPLARPCRPVDAHRSSVRNVSPAANERRYGPSRLAAVTRGGPRLLALSETSSLRAKRLVAASAANQPSQVSRRRCSVAWWLSDKPWRPRLFGLSCSFGGDS